MRGSIPEIDLSVNTPTIADSGIQESVKWMLHTVIDAISGTRQPNSRVAPKGVESQRIACSSGGTEVANWKMKTDKALATPECVINLFLFFGVNSAIITQVATNRFCTFQKGVSVSFPTPEGWYCFAVRIKGWQPAL